MSSLTLKELQRKVDEWIQQFEEGYWPPLAMFASLVEEVGELGREINNIERYKIKRESSTSALDIEIGDVLFSLICIANYFKVDIESALLRTLEKYTKRDS
ncbi:MAG: nucleotide pyrophosphohydrolase, partial [Candidatus Baldrarchaeia archaeon]